MDNWTKKRFALINLIFIQHYEKKTRGVDMVVTDTGTEFIIAEGHSVTVTRMGHLVEVQHMTRKNSTCSIRKIDADRYVNLETGEIHEFEKSETRADSESSLRRTFKQLRYLINANFSGNPNELFVTFTFAKDSYDSSMVYKDFDKFIKRLRYRFKDSTTIDYLNIVEPHASGQWHSHMLIRFNDLPKIYIPNKELEELWSHGFVKVKSLKDVDNIGAYVSAYLTDVELDQDTFMGAISGQHEVVYKDVDGETKMFVKGGRLKYYPPGMNIYRGSRGIKKPEREEMTYSEAKKIVGSRKPHYKKSYEIQRDDFKSTTTYEQYNLNRG